VALENSRKDAPRENPKPGNCSAGMSFRTPGCG
jgi:hypothetical protein